ncbi:hypothetical protein DRO60_02255, partial [Candidatus Bathyarchaeota archaeon]
RVRGLYKVGEGVVFLRIDKQVMLTYEEAMGLFSGVEGIRRAHERTKRAVSILFDLMGDGWMPEYFRVLRKVGEELGTFPLRLKKGFCALLLPKRMLEEAGFKEGEKMLVLWRVERDKETGEAVGADVVVGRLPGVEGAD